MSDIPSLPGFLTPNKRRCVRITPPNPSPMKSRRDSNRHLHNALFSVPLEFNSEWFNSQTQHSEIETQTPLQCEKCLVEYNADEYTSNDCFGGLRFSDFCTSCRMSTTKSLREGPEPIAEFNPLQVQCSTCDVTVSLCDNDSSQCQACIDSVNANALRSEFVQEENLVLCARCNVHVPQELCLQNPKTGAFGHCLMCRTEKRKNYKLKKSTKTECDTCFGSKNVSHFFDSDGTFLTTCRECRAPAQDATFLCDTCHAWKTVTAFKKFDQTQLTACIDCRIKRNVANFQGKGKLAYAACSQKAEHLDESSVLHFYHNESQVGEMDVECQHCNALMFMDERLSGSSKTHPEFRMCCKSGKIKLPPNREVPDELKELLMESSDSEFKKHIRGFNNNLAFASIQMNDTTIEGGVPNFSIQGPLAHRIISGLTPAEGHSPGFAQIYIYDIRNELQNRRAHLDLDHDTLLILQNMLHRVNPYVSTFKHYSERLFHNNALKDYKIVFKAEPGTDPRRSNAPTSDELAVLIPGNATNVPDRSMIIQERSGPLYYINQCHRGYDPLHYVLLHPRGEDGWNIGVKSLSTSKRVTAMAFYSYQLQQRKGIFNPILNGGRLFQHYCVDMYAKLEQQRLNYLKSEKGQKRIRADLYQGIQDALDNDVELSEIGVRKVLPSSFTGGPRYMTQQFQDALAIVRAFGKPDLFVTFTANPNWTEVQNSLLPGQKATDRPDIVSRVFNLKLKALIRLIQRKHIFGRVKGEIHVIEFQKRGLPHAHILLILHSEDKPRSSDDYDYFACAEIPNQRTHPKLFEIVKRHMLHGPCGTSNPNSSCMEHGLCKKKFPKQFSKESCSKEDSYPQYRRRSPSDGGNVLNKTVFMNSGMRNKKFTNADVVPYNAFLSLLFESHINVEICSSITAVKYLYKYVYKGHDRITFSVESTEENGQSRNIDEIKKYQDARYIGTSEACWRIFGLDLQAKSHTIVRLPLHLPGKQAIYYDESKTFTQEELEKKSITELTAYFTQNLIDPNAHKYTYFEFPLHYTWDSKRKEWKNRQSGQGRTLSRVYSASPSQGERYYLRMLLQKIRGATSFEHLRTLDDGTVCETFQEACIQHGWLDNDREIEQTLFEAVECMVGNALRNLFVQILVFGCPHNPKALWNIFADQISDDFFYRRSQNYPHFSRELLLNHARNDTLLYLQNALEPHGKELAHFMLPSPDETVPEILNLEQNPLINEEMRYDREELERFAGGRLETLNPSQKEIFVNVSNAVATDSSLIAFVDGPGGSGKTYLYETILADVRSRGKIALVVASSGIASLLLPGGRTFHSRFKAPIELDESSTCNVSKRSNLAQLIQKADMIIWDEAPMAHRFLMEALERTLRDIMGNERPFGGKVFLMGGDFRQNLPIIRRGSRGEIIAATLRKSPLWSHVKEYVLTQNMRVDNHSENSEWFMQWLLRLGEGKLPPFGCIFVQCTDSRSIFDQFRRR